MTRRRIKSTTRSGLRGRTLELAIEMTPVARNASLRAAVSCSSPQNSRTGCNPDQKWGSRARKHLTRCPANASACRDLGAPLVASTESIRKADADHLMRAGLPFVCIGRGNPKLPLRFLKIANGFCWDVLRCRCWTRGDE
jgi:hypothetical protein